MSAASPSVKDDGRAGLPVRYLARMQALLGEEFPLFLESYDHPVSHGLRVNSLKLTPAQFQSISPFSLTPVPWCPDGFLVADEDRPGKHPYHAAGLYYLQDPSAMSVAEVLSPQPGERVLDLAAAPGGKTTHLAALMQQQGLLVANDIKTKRIGHLAANLERWGAQHVTITNETPERLADALGPIFDRVLVDAPCSGEGMFRKDPPSRAAWSEEVIVGCAVRQKAILRCAAALVRPGGWLAYSTCTFAPEEDETLVAAFLDQFPSFELVRLPQWQAYASPGGSSSAGGALRFWPHQSPGEGHFVALLHRQGISSPASSPRLPVNARKPGNRRRPTVEEVVPHNVRRAYETFCQEVFAVPVESLPAADRLAWVGNRLYQLPEGLPGLEGLRVLHPGWWLGTVKTDRSSIDRFEPAHALAMGLSTSVEIPAEHNLRLAVDGPEVQAYLRGEVLRQDGPAGWLVVTVASRLGGDEAARGYPLGWGKRVQGAVKNHYPRGLLWL